jgi:hypothetical protein
MTGMPGVNASVNWRYSLGSRTRTSFLIPFERRKRIVVFLAPPIDDHVNARSFDACTLVRHYVTPNHPKRRNTQLSGKQNGLRREQEEIPPNRVHVNPVQHGKIKGRSAISMSRGKDSTETFCRCSAFTGACSGPARA